MKRKGITPIIAIVLLLLITVGAVGVVYTQFQSLTDTNPQEQINKQQKIQGTSIAFSSVYNNDTSRSATDGDALNITFRNTGDYTVNVTSDLTVSYNGLGFNAYPDTVSSDSECFTTRSGSESLDPGESYTCNTGVAFPDAGDSVSVEISMKGADKSWSHTCSPATSSSLTC